MSTRRLQVLQLAVLAGATLPYLACGGDSSTGPGGSNENLVTTVTISPSSATIPIGGEAQFTATARDGSGSVVSATKTWLVLPPSVASVTMGGLVRGLEAGNANVTATVDGRIGSASLTVEAPPRHLRHRPS